MAPDVCDLLLSRFTFSKTITPSVKTTAISFSDDGKYMYLGYRDLGVVTSYETSGNNWELDKQVIFGNFTVSGEFSNSWGLSVKPDGSELYVSGNTGLVNGSIVSWTLTTSYLFKDVTDVPTRIGSYGIGSISGITNIRDINIKPDGTRLLGWGNDTGENLYQLDMTAWTIGSMAYNSVKSSQSAKESFIPANGNCLFKGNGSVVEQYSFGTPWNTATLGSTLIDSLDLSAKLTTIHGLYVTDNRLFAISETGAVHQYNA